MGSVAIVLTFDIETLMVLSGGEGKGYKTAVTTGIVLVIVMC